MCENNQFAQSTRITNVSASSISNKAEGFGIKSYIADGLNPVSVNTTASEAIAYVRKHKHPRFCRQIHIDFIGILLPNVLSLLIILLKKSIWNIFLGTLSLTFPQLWVLTLIELQS